MNDWTDEQKELRKNLEQYFEPLSAGHVEDDVANVFPREKWDLIRQSGVIKLPFDEEWGGLGKDVLTMVYVLEHLGYGCRDQGLTFSLATQIVSVALPLQRFGSDDLKQRYLAKLIDGEIMGAHAISEPDAGSDAMAMSSVASDDGDAWVINGLKTYCTGGPVADILTVYAKLEGQESQAGFTAFLVEADTDGISMRDLPKMGLGTSPMAEITFENVRVPKENVIGKEGAGFFILEHVMTWEVLCIFVMMVGEMQYRMERCIDFAKKRKAFGEPIGKNQYVAGMIVDQKLGVENSRKHLYDTARLFLTRRYVTTEVSMAKLVTSEANLQSALSAVQIFGGRGYLREYGLEKDLRAAVGAPIYSGTDQMQRVRIASMLGL
jgi:alkylation response protein AidB-like acyl-CoA dehydrogenase